MILAIDIGNTMISIAKMQDGAVISKFQIPTRQKEKRVRTAYAKILKKVSGQNFFLEAVVVCCVVPALLKIIKDVTVKVSGQAPLIIGKDILVPMKNAYKYPRQVGQDRLVGAYAAMSLYRAPVLVVDLGTAITCDIVSRRQKYLGGFIVPGIRLSIESLFQETALLPKVIIRKPRQFIGRDTEGSILSGIFYGYGAMLTGLIRQIKGNMRKKPKVILTGGYVYLMREFIKTKIDGVYPDLIFKGIYLTWRDQD